MLFANLSQQKINIFGPPRHSRVDLRGLGITEARELQHEQNLGQDTRDEHSFFSREVPRIERLTTSYAIGLRPVPRTSARFLELRGRRGGGFPDFAKSD